MYEKVRNALAARRAHTRRKHRGASNYAVHIIRVVRHTKETNLESNNDTLRDMSKKIKGKKLASVIIRDPQARYEAGTPLFSTSTRGARRRTGHIPTN